MLEDKETEDGFAFGFSDGIGYGDGLGIYYEDGRGYGNGDGSGIGEDKGGGSGSGIRSALCEGDTEGYGYGTVVMAGAMDQVQAMAKKQDQ